MRRELPYYVTALALVLVVFYKVLDPDDPRLPNMPDVAVTVTRGKTTPINIWLASHGPDCKPVDGWKLVATAKHGSARIESVAGIISNSAYQSCNGRSIEGARLDYSGSGWFRSYDEIIVEMLSANTIIWRARYVVTFTS